MPITRPLALAFLLLLLLLLTGACASTPGERGSQEAETKPLRGGIAEFSVTFYDGYDLRGRVLLGATVEPLVIDGRLFEDSDVELNKARACGKKEVVEHYIVEWFAYPRPDEIVTLRRGYWYGSNVHFFLWDKQTGAGPDCFDAELVLRALDGRIAATLPIQVVRTDKPPAPPDGGAEEPKPPPSDAGAP